jgi:hypothetical protein
MDQATLLAAQAFLRAGLSLITVARDGSKSRSFLDLPVKKDEHGQPVFNGHGRPQKTWDPFKERLPTMEEAENWFGRESPAGIGVVGGKVSGNLEQIDFDKDAEDIFPQWCQLVEAECPGLLARLTVVKTPRRGGGYHVRYRCTGVVIPDNTELAMEPATDPTTGKPTLLTLIETRGEGGYALAPGSPGECHETGGTYEHVSGPKLSQVQDITPAERDVLIRCAAMFDRHPQEPGSEPGHWPTGNGTGDRPGDDFNRRGPDWSEILTGWTEAGQAGGKRCWKRPGKAGPGISATTGYCSTKDGSDLLAVFSTNAHPFEGPSNGKPCSCYSKFAAYAILHHAGDFKAAAKQLAAEGYGGHRREAGSCGGHGKDAAGQGDSPGATPWESVLPLSEVPRPMPFPLSVFPAAVRRAVEEAARALPCPPDYVAVPVLVMAGAAIGRSRVLAVKRGHPQPVLLYGAVVGPPGEGKSPALDVAVREAHDQEEKSREQWEKEKEQYEAALEEYKAAQKKKDEKGTGTKPEKPKRPLLRRLLIDNATVESLVPILKGTPRGLVKVQDELTAWVLSMNQYREGGKGVDRQFWLSNWSCTTVVVDRKKDHEQSPLVARNPFVAVIGGLTPDKLRTLRGDDLRRRPDADGFIDRVLFSFPDELPATAETWAEIDPQTLAGLHRVMGALRKLEMVPVKEGEVVKGWRPFVVNLTRCGKETWLKFTQGHAKERNADDFPHCLAGPWSKLRGYCARLALIIHYLRWACGEIDGGNQADVDGESVRRAALLVAYFKSHARKVYALIDADDRVSEARRVVRWLTNKAQFPESLNSLKEPQREIKRSDIHAGVWGGSRSVEEMERVLDLLCKHNVLRPKAENERRPGPGRQPSPRYEVNPALFAKDDSSQEPVREFRDSENSPSESDGAEATRQEPPDTDADESDSSLGDPFGEVEP